MQYQAEAAVWEMTMRCNMHCKHCGSSCTDQTAPHELTTAEALVVADDIGRLQLGRVTLSGGEPLLRADWPQIAARLQQHNVTPNMISNGWFFDEATVVAAKQAGISNIAISLDGLEKTHDYMRCRGSFARAINAYKLMQKGGMPSSVITTINKRNIVELDEMLKLFAEVGIYSWQLQIGAPMGNLAHHRGLLIEPYEVKTIIDFAHRHIAEGKVAIYLADCVGYYTQKEQEIKAATIGRGYAPEQMACWNGCHAGTRIFGILADGGVVGCASIRNASFIEDNVRVRSLYDIWHDDKNFAFNRKFDLGSLTGFCERCGYGSICRAGCSVTKLNFHGSLRENAYCAFRVAMHDIENSIVVKEPATMIAAAMGKIEQQDYQVAELVMVKTLEVHPNHLGSLCLLGYIYFQMQKYALCRRVNEAALKIDALCCDALKGLGLAFWKLGYVDEAIKYLRRACEVAPAGYADPQHDLQVVLQDSGRTA